MPAQPPLVFIIYAREDEPFRAELKKQLLPMERSGMLRVWTDRELIAGEHWEPAIKKQLKSADLILMLVSSDYFDSDYIHAVELREAIERHERGEARVVPVIVRPCAWETDTVVNSLQVLPTDGVPVNDTRHWHTHEAAWVDVVRGVRRTLQQLADERAENESARLAAEKADAERRAAEAQRAREAEAAQQREATARAEAEARRKADEADARQREQADAERRAAEENAWQNALQTGAPEALYNYLNHYPDGAYTREAKRRIKQQQQRSGNDGTSSPTPRYIAAGVTTVLFAVLAYILWPKPDPTPAVGTETTEQQAETPKVSENDRKKSLGHLADAYNSIDYKDMQQDCLDNLSEAARLDPGNAEIREVQRLLKSGDVPAAKERLRRLTGQ